MHISLSTIHLKYKFLKVYVLKHFFLSFSLSPPCPWEAELSNLRTVGRTLFGMAMNIAQLKIVNVLKTLRDSFVFVAVCVFNVWPKTTLLPVWPRDAKSLDTPALGSLPRSFHTFSMQWVWPMGSTGERFEGRETGLGFIPYCQAMFVQQLCSSTKCYNSC